LLFGVMLCVGPSGCEDLGSEKIEVCDELESAGGTWVRVRDDQCCFHRTDPDYTPTHREIINACTSAKCLGFDNSRLPPPGADVAFNVDQAQTVQFGPDECGDPQPASTCVSASDEETLSACPDPALFVIGSNAIYPVLEAMGQAIAAETKMPLVYVAKSSCDAVRITFSGEAVTARAVYWDDTSGPLPCLQSKIPDIAVSDSSATLCSEILGTIEPSLKEAMRSQDNPTSTSHHENLSLGPVQAHVFIQPETATDGHVLSQEAFYHLFALSNVAPWKNDCHIFRRNFTSGTLNVIAQTLGVIPHFFQGREMGCTDMMLGAMQALGSDDGAVASQAIGIYDVINAERDKAEGVVRTLAFQARYQECGYWPDQAIGARDKRNVRDGHYVLWDNLHLFFNPSAADRQVFIPLIAANKLPGARRKSMLSSIIQGALVPQCAMRVQWLTDPEDPRSRSLTPFKPQNRIVCSCFYDLVTTGEALCRPCEQEDGPCTTAGGAAGTCYFGFCEPNEGWPEDDVQRPFVD
jgi:hypothetical protein